MPLVNDPPPGNDGQIPSECTTDIHTDVFHLCACSMVQSEAEQSSILEFISNGLVLKRLHRRPISNGQT